MPSSSYSSSRIDRPACLPVQLVSTFGLGLRSHHPSRTLKTVIRNASVGDVWYPMLGDAAAPEMAIARPTVSDRSSRRVIAGSPVGMHVAVAALALLIHAVLEPAVAGREGERGGLALLPRQVLAAHQVERGVEDGVRPRGRPAERGQREVVLAVEPGERVGLARARRSKVTAHQPVAVEQVQRKLVQVHQPRHPPRHDGERHPLSCD